MFLRACGSCLPKYRSLILLSLIMFLVFALAPSASSQASEGEEPPSVEAPPREWATLDASIGPQDSLVADLGQKTAMSITIANNGNIAAMNVEAIADGGDMLVGERVRVDEI